MEWISVNNELPNDMEPVMVTVRSRTNSNFVDMMKDVIWCSSDGGGWYATDGDGYIEYLDGDMEVTHWMPYPEPAGKE